MNAASSPSSSSSTSTLAGDGAVGSGFRPVTMFVPWLCCIVIAVLAQYVVGPVVGPYWQTVLQKIGVFVIAAVGLNIVNGFTGQFSMGHAGFMAIGGYIAGAVTYYGSLWHYGDATVQTGFLNAGVGMMLAGLLCGATVSALFGYIVGLPSLRLRGDYLAIVTLGFGEIIRVLLQQTTAQEFDAAVFRENPWATISRVPLSGSLGLSGVPQYATLFWVFLFVSAMILIAYRIKQSSSGRALLSIRENEIAARAMGINLIKYKVRAFVMAAFFGGLAGGLWAHAGQNFSPTEAGFQRSFDIIILVVLGGLGSISGAAIAAIALTALTEVLRGPEVVLDQWWQVLLVGVVLAIGAAVLRGMQNRGARVLLIGAMVPVALVLFALLSRVCAKSLGVNLGDYRMVLYAAALIVVMLVRPNGLMGVQELWDLFGKRKGDRAAREGGAA